MCVCMCVCVCVQNKLFGRKKLETTNNEDSTDTDTDIFFANDYKAAKARALKYTLLEYARTVESAHSNIRMNKKKDWERERKTQTKERNIWELV